MKILLGIVTGALLAVSLGTYAEMFVGYPVSIGDQAYVRNWSFAGDVGAPIVTAYMNWFCGKDNWHVFINSYPKVSVNSGCGPAVIPALQ